MRFIARIAPWAPWAAGGLVVVPLDALHVSSGTIPVRAAGLEVAIPMFVLGGVVVGLAHRHVAIPLAARLSSPSSSAVTGMRALVVTLVFLAAYASSSFVLEHALAATLAYAAAFAAIVAVTPSDRRLALLVMAGGAAVVGPAFEGTFAASGAFAYARPDFYNVPAWLPCIYALTGAAVSVVDSWLLTRTRRS